MLDLIDDDTVCLTNLNRQIIATRKTVGKFKVDMVKERIMEINPDAVDTVTAKLQLVMEAQAAGIPVISCMGAGNKLDPAGFEVADIYQTSVCPLAKVMRRELKKRGVKHLKVVYSREKPLRPIEDMAICCRSHCICPPGAKHKCTERRDIPGSNAFVPAVAGLILAGEVIKDLAGAGERNSEKVGGL